VTLRLWELLVAGTLGALTLMFASTGHLLEACVLIALLAFAITSRAGIVQAGQAGRWPRMKGRLLIAQAAALSVIYVGAAVFLFLGSLDRWTRDLRGAVAIYALIGVVILLKREIEGRAERAVNHFVGAGAEERVAANVDPLKAEGWSVAHDLMRPGRGNLDHLVWSDRGAFAIETKSGRLRKGYFGAIKSNAAWAKETFGARWVQPVICVCSDPPAMPYEENGVWVMGPDEIVEWLRSQPLRRRDGLARIPA
jgi:hypothetical protein